MAYQDIALYVSHTHLEPRHVMLWLRVTARISAILLAGSFASPGPRQLWPSALTRWIRANRHRFTLLFAASHTLHLAGVVALASLIPDQVLSRGNLPGVILGAGGYALIYYVAWKAFTQRHNPERPDTTMQTFGLYVLWAVFTLAFTSFILRDAWTYAPLASLMWFALVVRWRTRFAHKYSGVIS